MSELDRALHLADDVIRHKVIRPPEGVAGRATRTPATEEAPEPTPAASRSEQ